MFDDDLWAEASRDIEREQHLLALSRAKSASSGTWAFIARAATHSEFNDRVALSMNNLTKAASDAGVPTESLISIYAQQYNLLKEAEGGEGKQCANCGHTSEEHANGAPCPTCSCKNFMPAMTEPNPGRSVEGSKDDDSDDDDDDKDDNKDDDDADDKDDDKDDSDDDDKDDEEDDDKNENPFANKFSSFSDRVATLKVALEEGVDPLTWLDGGSGSAAAEVPIVHQTDSDFSHSYSEVPSAINAVSVKTSALILDHIQANDPDRNDLRTTASTDDEYARHQSWATNAYGKQAWKDYVASRRPLVQKEI